MPETATYLYCVVRSARRPSAARVPDGVPGGERPGFVTLGDELWLVVSQVPLGIYGPEKLEPALRDLEWVSTVAVAHEAVVEHFTRASSAAVVPMKLFTMFSTVERAVEEMRPRRAEIAQVLKRISGCEEWGIRVTRMPSRVTASSAGVRRITSGAAFLAAKKAVRDQTYEAARLAAEAAEDAFAALALVAREARRRDDVPSAAKTPPLLDAAFLVPARSRARFHGTAKKLAETCSSAGAEMTLSGPWPAYNFIQAPGPEPER
jgi:hypothetical protein